MNTHGKAILVVGAFLLLVLASAAVLTAQTQAQNRRWEEIQQRFILHATQLEQEGRDSVPVQIDCIFNSNVPTDISTIAWYTHWHAWSWSSEDPLYWQAWQNQKERLTPQVHIVDWKTFHSTIITKNIKTIYYWQPERPSCQPYEMSTGCFYVLDGQNIYILFD